MLGTARVKNIYPDFFTINLGFGTIQIPVRGDSNPSNFVAVNNILFFTAKSSTNGIELWRTDGTEAGTFMVRDINPVATANGPGDSNPSNLTVIGNIVYFSATDGTNGVELWRSDGTNVGTMVQNINSITGDSNPNNLTNVNGILFFAGK